MATLRHLLMMTDAEKVIIAEYLDEAVNVQDVLDVDYNWLDDAVADVTDNGKWLVVSMLKSPYNPLDTHDRVADAIKNAEKTPE